MFGMARKEGATVVRVLAEQLRRDIAFGVLAPDGRLKIDALRRSYGGSAHSLREALTHLVNDGLVEASDQRGFRVTSATQADLDDITRLRIEIEPLGLAWSIERGDVGWEGSVIAALHGYMRAAADLADAPAERALDWEEAGRAFHASLLAAC